ncbi:cytosolic protein [Thiospirillum jenense]|uniref:Cytosolic protein n=1 Tax=Thiospirillum jenense TaxID=1653858 RepID=A0A839HIB1_9GAMM|nr:cytosolic protein [Thiospirillum jenense]
MNNSAITRDDYDSPWKDLLDRWTQPFVEFFFAHAAADIDWQRGLEPLDKELQKVTRHAKQGRGYVDKLIKVWRLGGEETWVLIHIEIQNRPEADFAHRMYTYHSRLSDRYQHPVASFAVLADSDYHWRPQHYEHQLWNCRALLEFPTVKLLDYAPAQLAVDPNPFALVVRAQLAATATRRDPIARLAQKIDLTRALYRAGWKRTDVIDLYTFIDWVLALPDTLEVNYHEEIQSLEEELKMRYVTTAERIGFQKGIEHGIEQGETEMLLRLLQLRFGELPTNIRQRVANANATDRAHWLERALVTHTLDELFVQ